MSSQGNVKGHVFQKQAWDPYFMFNLYFLAYNDSVCKKFIENVLTSITLIPP